VDPLHYSAQRGSSTASVKSKTLGTPLATLSMAAHLRRLGTHDVIKTEMIADRLAAGKMANVVV